MPSNRGEVFNGRLKKGWVVELASLGWATTTKVFIINPPHGKLVARLPACRVQSTPW